MDHRDLRLLDDDALERSPVVANSDMNRERRLPAYRRELGVDILALLHGADRVVRWLDLCCGTANALFEAAHALGDRAEIVGVDLVGYFAGPPRPPRLRLVTASVTSWTPDAAFDLITCVHGLHYVGDKLGVIARAASWLTDDGLFAANLDVRSVRRADGTPAGRRLTADLRASGLVYDARNKRVSCRGRREIDLPWSYLGADDRAGPNYTGQGAVDSYYAVA
ncbi:class I SAM-dependent methyltransferase [Microbispora bryophytorum]|uniref:Class I SAM-dependent methyltransferase n=1 Tax=Microbispora bryophytorum subsp. camponoti TaxID=1677852 RepID=A0ABR8L5Q1_9ACTN|nr:class I SAM-dependent methyltransferase [Microbispora camponoti]MBD3146268.1 class I SAM-dependent methyltransferase [Microbispora camponoti]